jgi:hypothetical protein
MIENALAYVYSFVNSKNAQGIIVRAFSFLKEIPVDFQPKALNEVQAQAWGVNAQNANTKRIFFENDDGIEELQRFVVNKRAYELRGLNPWPSHTEGLLIPITGTSIPEFVLAASSDTSAFHLWMDDEIWGDSMLWQD